MVKKFTMKKGKHEVETSLPAEVTQLRAAGYSEVPAKKAASPTTTAAKK